MLLMDIYYDALQIRTSLLQAYAAVAVITSNSDTRSAHLTTAERCAPTN